MAARPIPENYHAVTPYLVLNDAAAAIEFYKRAFGATEFYRMPMPDGKIMHAEITIGGSPVMLCDEFPQMGSRSAKSMGGSPVTIHLFVEDVDKVFAQATAAGAKGDMPPTDMFWGDRFSKITDPFGHSWSIATHVKDMTPEEVNEAAKKAFSGSPGC